MPKVDNSILSKRDQIVSDVEKIVDPKNVLSHIDEIKPYETDALAAYKQVPLMVVLPETVKEVSKILKYCNENKIKVVPRGAGTGLSGGSLPLQDCILLAMGKFNKVLELDFENRCVVTQPCVTNLAITQAVQDKGFYYAPDPSSQIACSIGGNVAENSGGVHSLKYGATTNNLLGIEVVLMDGTITRFGGKAMDAEGYEPLILDGMAETLAKNPHIQIITEYNPYTLEIAGNTGENFIKKIENMGFIISIVGSESMSQNIIKEQLLKIKYPNTATLHLTKS